MADVVEATRFEVELQDSTGLLSKQAGSPYVRDRKTIDGSSKPREDPETSCPVRASGEVGAVSNGGGIPARPFQLAARLSSLAVGGVTVPVFVLGGSAFSALAADFDFFTRDT
ncbi:hypothetical protein MTO96_004398 [Rhipicephalus appendiculatus]